MNLTHPFELVTPTLDGGILAVLARADAAFTPGQIQKLMGRGAVVGIRRALDRIGGQGIVHAERTPNAVLYSLNREHMGAKWVIGIATLRTQILNQLSDALAGFPIPPSYAALFGSAARNEMRSDSDLDVFIVRPRRVDSEDQHWRGSLVDLSLAATRWTGNDLKFLEYGEAELSRRARSSEPALAAVVEDGIPLVGDPAWLRERVKRQRA